MLPVDAVSPGLHEQGQLLNVQSVWCSGAVGGVSGPLLTDFSTGDQW